MQRERKDKSFIKKPIYPGGLKAMRTLISESLKYPGQALQNKIEGTVYLRYDINYKGKVIGAKILSSLGYGCDEEAIRLVHLFNFNVPKGPRKIKVVFHKTIKIYFRLPKPNKVQPIDNSSTNEIVYTISKHEKEKSSPIKKSSYTYTIEWN